MSAIFSEMKKLIDVETGIERSIDAFRHTLRKEAVAFAVEALHQWVSRGVEYYHANRGWIFMIERNSAALRTIPGATVRSTRRNFRIRMDEMRDSFVWHVFRAGKGDLSNNVKEDIRRGTRGHARGYCCIDKLTRSELAVPIFDENGPEGGNPIGVYNLEADLPDVFFPALVQELQKNMALLTPHLLILKKWRDRKLGDKQWIWHPEVHGWSPGKLAEGFCHSAVSGATLKRSQPPTFTIWNGDIRKDQKHSRCWVLGTCDYDYDFQSQLALDLNDSVTGSVAQLELGRYVRDKDEGKLRNYNKAKRRSVQQFHIGSLTNVRKGVCGTLNMYALHESTMLPGPSVTGELCVQASQLLADVNDMRTRLSIAYINGQLAKAADPTPHPVIFRRALMKVLPCDAATLFVPQTLANGKTILVAIESSGFIEKDDDTSKNDEQPGKPIARGVEFPVDDPLRPSITAHCFTQSEPVRINFQSEIESHAYGVPSPSREHPEVVVFGDAHPTFRRRLGIGVPGNKTSYLHGDTASGDSRHRNVGVIRLYRSSAGRPFTQADAELLRQVVSMDRCHRLFENWAIRLNAKSDPNFDPKITLLDPDIPIPPSRSILPELQTKSKTLKAERAYLFVRRGHHYEEFVCFPPHELPPETTTFQPESLEQPTVTEIRSSGGSMFRACWPLMAWSGELLTRTILAFEFADREAAVAALQDSERQIREALMIVASRLTMNLFYPESKSSDVEGNRAEFIAYVTDKIKISAERETHFESPAEEPDYYSQSKLKRIKPFARARFEESKNIKTSSPTIWCPDPDLDTYGVGVWTDGSHCRIPLRTGTETTEWLICALDSDFGKHLQVAMEAATYENMPLYPSKERLHGHEATWSQLRRSIGYVVGAWSRIIAPITEQQLKSNMGRNENY